MSHIPVLLNEVIKFLDPKPGEFFIDGTAGSGGHAAAIFSKIMPAGKLLAIDRDERNLGIILQNLENEAKKLKIGTAGKLILLAENYANLPKILEEKNFNQADGLLLDLGFSSEQLIGRGFSFQKDEPLLMTYDIKDEPLSQILKELTELEIEKIIREYGEEKYADKIAQAIWQREQKKPMVTTGELAATIQKAVPANYERGRINPATRTFQALRIYTNHELENLEYILQNLGKIVKAGGRVVIIAYHSLEDRLVKNYFRDYAKAGTITLLTKKPIAPDYQEIKINPRARSAKLRAALLS